MFLDLYLGFKEGKGKMSGLKTYAEEYFKVLNKQYHKLCEELEQANRNGETERQEQLEESKLKTLVKLQEIQNVFGSADATPPQID